MPENGGDSALTRCEEELLMCLDALRYAMLNNEKAAMHGDVTKNENPMAHSSLLSVANSPQQQQQSLGFFVIAGGASAPSSVLRRRRSRSGS
ncbi:hypothetical protein ACLKA7_015021 [Drosophila subpalustris]